MITQLCACRQDKIIDTYDSWNARHAGTITAFATWAIQNQLELELVLTRREFEPVTFRRLAPRGTGSGKLSNPTTSHE